MFENITSFFKKFNKKTTLKDPNSKETAKERLHLVLMQDRANMSVDFLELMKQEIIEVIKKYIQIDENAIDVRLTNKEKNDGGVSAPALYANIPILNIKNETVDGTEAKGQLKKESKEIVKKSEEKVPEKAVEKVTEKVTQKKEIIKNKEPEKVQTKLDEKKQVKEIKKTIEEKKVEQNLEKSKEDLKQAVKKEKVSVKSEN